MNKYTFLSDNRIANTKDFFLTAKLGEEAFKTAQDPTQMQLNKKRIHELAKHFAEGINLIYYNNEFIGFVYLQPATKQDMNEFLKGNITEEELTQKTIKQQLRIQEAEAIYLVAAIIQEKHQRKGLATTAYKKLLDKYVKQEAHLFSWAYTKQGEALINKLEQELQRTIHTPCKLTNQ
ncbi:MAG: GNAT family N-acetyltransferase [Candidatus Woesearchaeota archaeon]